MRHPHPMVPLRGAGVSVPGVVLSPDAAGGNAGLLVSPAKAKGEASALTPPLLSGSRVLEGKIEGDLTGALTYTLPEPPSANRYWRRHGHTIYRTREAKAYVELVASLTHAAQRDGAATFPDQDVSISVVWHRSAKRGDLPNRTKILYDALQGTVYADDNQIAQEHTQRVDAHPWLPKGQVIVTVNAL